MKLSEYLAAGGWGSISKLANQIGAHAPDVSSWASESEDSRSVPVVHCVRIEQVTEGQVTRKDLRPDDWHLIWPELINQDTWRKVIEFHRLRL